MYSEETIKSCTHATAKRTIRFIDGSIHEEGKDYEITPDTLSYFVVCQKDYDFSFVFEFEREE